MWTRIGFVFLIFASLNSVAHCTLENVTEVKGDAQGYGMRFRLPFIDIDVQSVSNLKIIKDSAGQELFILHGAEFYQVILERNIKRLTLIAILNGGVREDELLGAKIISWNNYSLLVIATHDHLEVYQIEKKTIAERASNHDEYADPLKVDPIQQITIYGQFRGLYLFPAAEDSVTLILFVGYTKLYSRLSSYEWMDTFFELSEEKTIAPVQNVSPIGSEVKYLIATRMSKSKNTMSIIVFDVSSSIEQVQTMQLPAKSVQGFTYQGKHYLIACSSGKQKCTYLKMKAGQFVVSKKRPTFEFLFDKITAGEHFIVGQKGNDVLVYINARMDCYGTFRSDRDDVTKILTHINEEGNEFIVLSYIRPLTALVRIVEVEHEMGRAASNDTVEDVDDLGSALKQQKHAFEETINSLRGVLLSRKYLLDEIKQSVELIKARSRDIVVNGSLHIESGKIGIVKIVGSKLRSPVEIKEKLQQLKEGKFKTRVSRHYEAQLNKSFTPDFKVRKLLVGNLIYDGPLLEGFSLNPDGTVLKIRPPVVTDVLETKELLTATVMQSRLSRQSYTRSVSSPRTKIRQLRVQRINGVSWDEFYESLFLRSRDSTIHGRLILQSTAEIGNLTASVLNGMPSDKLFNLVEDQTITSNILISRFFTSDDLTVGSLNGLDFARDVARNGVDNFILSPVLARDITVTGKFILSERDGQARHIFGTSVQDFQQIYTGRVIIEGSLTLHNLEIEPRSRMLVNGREMPSDFYNHFWMYTLPQAIEVPVRFGNCQVSAPTLNTLHLNSHPVSSYLLTSGQENIENVLLIFLSAHIEGNVMVDPAFPSKLRQISENALRVGDSMMVSGEKVFLGRLDFDHGEISTLNDLHTSDLVSVNEANVIFTGSKTFESIHVVDEAEISQNLNIVTFNGDHSANDHVPISQTRFGTVVFTSPFKAQNIVFKYLNGFAAKKIFSGIEMSGDQIVLHKDLFIEGNTIFQSSLQVDTINSIVWDEYLKSVVRTNENTVISGIKTFASDLKIVSDLETPVISDLEVDNFYKNYLSKSRFQEITGSYSFDNLQLMNINVPFINGLSTAEFIDTRSPEVIFTSELVVPSLQARGNFGGNLGVDLQSFVDRIHSIDYSLIKELHVLGNAHWPWGNDQQSLDLQYLFKHAVRRADDQVITGRVKLKKPLINVMQTSQAFPPDIDFDFIARDCLLLNSSIEEVVMATKVFHRPLEIMQAKAKARLAIKTVNRVDIAKLNSSIYRLSDATPLQGKLIFETPPIFGFLNVEGTVNGMPTDGIFLTHEGRKWPPTTFNRLHIADLQLTEIDNMNLDFLLANRVRKSGSAQEIFGHITFDELVVEKEANIPSINNIKLDNVVYKNSEDLQEVTGEKTILGELQLHGPIVVGRLNGEDVIERYRKTILLDRSYSFDNLFIERAEFMGGLIVNGHSFGDLVKGSPNEDAWRQYELTLKHIESTLNATEKLIQVQETNSKRLVYFDYDFSAVTEWKTANDANQEVFTFNDNRYQHCDREQTTIKWSRYHNRFYISKAITNTVTAEEYGTKVTAENACKEGYRNVYSLITITEPHFTKQLKVNNLVQSIEIYYAGGIYVLLHVIDMYAGKNEIRTLKIDSNLKKIQDWQLLTDGIGKTYKLFKQPSHTILIVSTVIDNYPSIAIYHLNVDTQIFEITQVIDGDFDIIELAQISPHKFHIFLSCERCHRIAIFEYDSQLSSAEDCHLYQIYQVIKLQASVDRFNLFTLPDGGMYLLVLSDRDVDFYHIYKYRYIQGWKHYTYGYFKDIQKAYPLLRDGMSVVDGNLLLLCNAKCTLVKAYYQG